MIKRLHFENTKLKLNKKGLFLFLSIIILFLIDILSKYYFSGKKYFEGNIIYINSTINTGSAFSMFSEISNYNLSIAILGLITIFLLIYFKYYTQIFNNLNIIWILIITGILGNTYDRFIYGHIRDFIGISNFFIFNLADLYLSLGVILYLIYEINKYKSK